MLSMVKKVSLTRLISRMPVEDVEVGRGGERWVLRLLTVLLCSWLLWLLLLLLVSLLEARARVPVVAVVRHAVAVCHYMHGHGGK